MAHSIIALGHGNYPKALHQWGLLLVQAQLILAFSPAILGKVSRQPVNCCGFPTVPARFLSTIMLAADV